MVQIKKAHIKGDHPAHVAKLADRMERDLGAIRRAMRKPLNAEIARGQLTLPQTAVMRVVVRRPAIRLSDLNREVSLAHSTVSGIVDRLEKSGMVKREPDDFDKRIMRVRPTEKVTSWIDEQLPALKRGPLQTALQRAKPEERETLAKAVTRLRRLLARD
jgi:DNA-binding MarR family transcriptional regulator